MTDEEIGYRRINASVYLHQEERKITDAGIEWNPHFIERMEDYNITFKNLFQENIINEIGETGWAISFVQVSQENSSWFVDVYVNSTEHFPIIVGIINKYIPKEFKLGFWYKGGISDYIHNQ